MAMCVKAIKVTSSFITDGNIYEVARIDADGDYMIYDDDGDNYYINADELNSGKWELLNKFNKADLRTGDVLVLRNGERYVVMKDYGKTGKETYLSINGYGWINPKNYNSDMTNKLNNNKQFDVMQVMRPNDGNINFKDMNEGQYEVVFERVEPKKMTVEEIEAILGYKVAIVDQEGKESE